MLAEIPETKKPLGGNVRRWEDYY